MASLRANEEEIFKVAQEIKTPESRDSYLQMACGDDELLKQRVIALLKVTEEEASFLEEPVAEIVATEIRPVTEQPGDTIGPYKLLQQIGEGGMGTVFMAEQSEPVERRVALKIIKPGMDTQQVIARFEAERQALAMMDHPNIAKVLDAGTTDTGRPYFVMELVKGIPVTKYCDQEHLTVKERLELFLPICQAIQHAHQKGIIHRDVKPTNILVARYDGKPVPKVIDFGVAKATSHRLTEKTMFTQYGQIVGTIEYMSPEQAEFNQLDIDTRSDIYSLGVLLYELLTGETPFDKQRLRSAAFDELLRIIREEEPPRPSTKLSSSQSLPNTAVTRKIEPKKLSLLIRGELDWIVMKALEKDRNRRYETATSFANDIQLYLDDEPVAACPPSAAYKFRKFARRNKVVIGTTAAIAASLIAGIITTSWQAYLVGRERDRAVIAEGNALKEAARADKEALRANAEAEKAKSEAKRADSEAAVAKAVNDFLNDDLLGMADAATQAEANLAPDPNIKLRTLLDRAAENLDGRFPDQPLVAAAIHYTIGRAYRSIGDYNKAEYHARLALDLHQQEAGMEDLGTLISMINLTLVYHRQGRYSEAERLHNQTLKMCRKSLGEEHRTTLDAMNNLANLYSLQGKYADAAQLHQQTLEIRQRTLGEEHPDTIASMSNLANVYYSWGQFTRAERLDQKALVVLRQKLGDEHPRTLSSRHNLACVYLAEGRHADAERLHQKILITRRRILGDEHPSTLSSMVGLGMVYQSQRRFAEAETLFREALEIRRQTLGEDHPDTLQLMGILASCYRDQHHYNEAEELCRETVQLQRMALGKRHPHTLDSMNRLAYVLERKDQRDEAVEIYQDAIAIYEDIVKEDPDNCDAYRRLGHALRHSGAPARAIVAYRQALSLNPSDAWTWNALDNATNDYGGHEAMIETCSELIGHGPTSYHAYRYRGEAYLATGKVQEAIGDYRLAAELCRKSLAESEGDVQTRESLGNTLVILGKALRSNNQHDEAESALREGLKVWQELIEEYPEKPQYVKNLGAYRQLGIILKLKGKYAEALTCFKQAVEASPNDHWIHHALAGFLLYAKDETYRDAVLAAEHANRAVELNPKDGRHHRHLGEACYRLQDWSRAVASMEKAVALGQPLDVRTDFQLAICYGHLKNQEKAAGWYAQAVALMEKQTNSDDSLIELQEQAKQLIESPTSQTVKN